jgi:hypothetical protein
VRQAFGHKFALINSTHVLQRKNYLPEIHQLFSACKQPYEQSERRANRERCRYRLHRMPFDALLRVVKKFLGGIITLLHRPLCHVDAILESVRHSARHARGALGGPGNMVTRLIKYRIRHVCSPFPTLNYDRLEAKSFSQFASRLIDGK